MLKYYGNFVDTYLELLHEIDLLCKQDERFDNLYKEFESQKICYLPFTMFLVKPLQRITHYRLLTQRLLEYYGTTHYDYKDTFEIFLQIDQLDKRIQNIIHDIENKQKLMDLQRDLIGVENLNTSDSKNCRVISYLIFIIFILNN